MTDSVDIAAIREDMDAAMREIPHADRNAIRVRQAPPTGGPSDVWIANDLAVDGRVLLYAHGGAFVLGSAEMYANFVSHLCHASRAEAFIPNYRLAPEHRFPAALDDLAKSYVSLLDIGTKPASIALVADSAGAALAVGMLSRIYRSDPPVQAPAALVLMSPWLDLTLSGRSIETNSAHDTTLDASVLEFFASEYLGGVRPDHPEASPPISELPNLPPCFVTAGAHEILLDDAMDVAGANRDDRRVALEVFEDRQHNFQFDVANDPFASLAVAMIGRFLDSNLAPG